MAFHLPTTLLCLFLLAAAAGVKWSECTNITIINDCKETVWPGITPNDNFGGFTLKPGQSAVFDAPLGWKGRIWGRTGCNFDGNGNGPCQTGGCGGTIKCTSPGQPPASLAEFSLGGGNDLDYYDVSLVDGFNLPLVITPLKGKNGNCSIAGCDSDLRPKCPPELASKPDGKTIACRSACTVFNTDEYCCRGMYANPVTCLPTNYSRIFKSACPSAYSYAHDDPTSILTCSTTDYVVTFCSSRNQTQCTYHDHELSCNGSNGVKTLITGTWVILMLSLPLVINNFRPIFCTF